MTFPRKPANSWPGQGSEADRTIPPVTSVASSPAERLYVVSQPVPVETSAAMPRSASCHHLAVSGREDLASARLHAVLLQRVRGSRNDFGPMPCGLQPRSGHDRELPEPGAPGGSQALPSTLSSR